MSDMVEDESLEERKKGVTIALYTNFLKFLALWCYTVCVCVKAKNVRHFFLFEFGEYMSNAYRRLVAVK